MTQDDHQIHLFLPVQPVQVCILPVQRTGGLVSGLAYDPTPDKGERESERDRPKA